MRLSRCWLAVLWLIGPGCSGLVSGDPDAGTALPDGSVPDAGGPLDSGQPADDAGAPDAGEVPVDAGVDAGCPPVVPEPQPTGTTRELNPGGSLSALLAQSAPGDRVRVHAGSYPMATLTAAFTAPVFIEAAAGETVSFAGLRFTNSSYLVLRGLDFTDTLAFVASHHVTLDGVHVDLGSADASGLEINGQSSGGACHDFKVVRSRFTGGARTIFILGKFAPSATWNSALQFVDDEFVCGSHNCFQLSGARDTLIARSTFHDPKADGILTAGATRITIERNRMLGLKSVAATAVRLASPGKEWDNYAGVENMISSDITVANNLMVSWGSGGIELDAATDVRIVFNTVADSVGFKTWARVPHDQQGNVILTGNTQVKLWNNILPSIQLDSSDPRPVFESNNLVQTGGGGANLFTGAGQYVDTASYVPAPGSQAIDHAVSNADTPLVDLQGRARGAMPDIGAVEAGASPSVCP